MPLNKFTAECHNVDFIYVFTFIFFCKSEMFSMYIIIIERCTTGALKALLNMFFNFF